MRERELFNRMSEMFSVTKDRHNNLLSEQADIDTRMAKLQKTVGDSEKAAIVLKKFSSERRVNTATAFENLCTAALQSVFGDKFVAKVKMTDKETSKPRAELVMVDVETGAESDPIEGNGGGAVDILSTALRMVVMENMIQADGPLILDEPYKHLSADYVPRVSEFIKQLSEDSGRQVIMSTHNDYLASAADEVFSLHGRG